MIFTLEEIKKWGFIPETKEDRKLRPLSNIVDRLHIIPILGEPLFLEIELQKESNTLTPENQLVVDRLLDLYGYSFMYQGIQVWNIGIFKVGIGKQKTETFDPLQNDEIPDYSLKLLNIVKGLEEDLKNFLNNNYLDYPLYVRTNKPRTNGGWYINKTNNCN